MQAAHLTYFRTGVGNIRPAGQIRPAKQNLLAHACFLAKNVYAEEASLRFVIIILVNIFFACE